MHANNTTHTAQKNYDSIQLRNRKKINKRLPNEHGCEHNTLSLSIDQHKLSNRKKTWLLSHSGRYRTCSIETKGMHNFVIKFHWTQSNRSDIADIPIRKSEGCLTRNECVVWCAVCAICKWQIFSTRMQVELLLYSNNGLDRKDNGVTGSHTTNMVKHESLI